MSKKQLVLPRKDEDGNYYISYSQLSKWKRSKRDYIRKYFFGEPDDNAALQLYGDFGHKVGEAYENNDFSAWEEHEAKFLQTLPHLDEFEREIKLKMDGFYVLGYIDTNSSPEIGNKEGEEPAMYVRELADYKTGDIEKRSPEYEDDSYLQVDIYAAALEQEYGKLPDKGSVVLIGRSGNAFAGEELNLTMEAAVIDKPITKERCEQVLAQVQELAEDVSAHYVAYLKLTGNYEQN